MGRHIPGNPTMVPQNMPGAGSLRVAGFLYNAAPKDGTDARHVRPRRRDGAADRLDRGRDSTARKFTWLGSGSDQVSLCATWHTSPVKTWSDMLKMPFTVGGEGRAPIPTCSRSCSRTCSGAKLKLVSGYPGGAEVNLAMERGEVDGRCGWSWSSIKITRSDWLAEQARSTSCCRWRCKKSPSCPMCRWSSTSRATIASARSCG